MRPGDTKGFVIILFYYYFITAVEITSHLYQFYYVYYWVLILISLFDWSLWLSGFNPKLNNSNNSKISITQKQNDVNLGLMCSVCGHVQNGKCHGSNKYIKYYWTHFNYLYGITLYWVLCTLYSVPLILQLMGSLTTKSMTNPDLQTICQYTHVTYMIKKFALS